jgi:hypothetical protein
MPTTSSSPPCRSGDRFVGEICGFGTTSGTRLVIGRWTDSPLGVFTDVMVERPDGRRLLIAPSDAVAAYVAGVYTFDETRVAGIRSSRTADRLAVSADGVAIDVAVGRRDPLGWLLRAVPRPIATSPRWARLVDPAARVTLRGVRTRARTPSADEFYAATDRHRLVGVTARLLGEDLGPMTDVVPAVRFGGSSAPRRPSIVALTTTVCRRPARQDGMSPA